jgi:hypothetical protein
MDDSVVKVAIQSKDIIFPRQISLPFCHILAKPYVKTENHN